MGGRMDGTCKSNEFKRIPNLEKGKYTRMKVFVLISRRMNPSKHVPSHTTIHANSSVSTASVASYTYSETNIFRPRNRQKARGQTESILRSRRTSHAPQTRPNRPLIESLARNRPPHPNPQTSSP